MADIGQVEALTGGLDSPVRKAFKNIFTYVLGDIRIGFPDNGKRATNLRLVRADGTTHATANTEFTVAHRLERVPSMLLMTLNLSAVNATMPRLTVSRAADASRMYFTSDSTSAPFTVFLD